MFNFSGHSNFTTGAGAGAGAGAGEGVGAGDGDGAGAGVGAGTGASAAHPIIESKVTRSTRDEMVNILFLPIASPLKRTNNCFDLFTTQPHHPITLISIPIISTSS